MSQLFFEAALLLIQPKSYKDNTLREQELKKHILVGYFLDNKRTAELRKDMDNKTLAGSYWDPHKDQTVIKEYLSSLSNQELDKLLQALQLKAVYGFYILPNILSIFIKILTPIIRTYYTIKESGRGLRGLLYDLLYSKKVANNPEIELTLKEKRLCPEYSKLFEEAAKDNKKYHKLYRDITKTANSAEQVISGLLYYLKSKDLSNNYQVFEVSEMLSKIEQKLLNGNKISDPGVVEKLEELIKDNLEKAYIFQQQGEINCLSNQVKLEKISNAVKLFKNIVMKVIDKEQQLAQEALTKIEFHQITNFVLNYKRKILHFIVKTNAFAKEETLQPGVQLNFKYSFQGIKYPTYLDFWLSKVPEKHVGLCSWVAAANTNKRVLFDPKLACKQEIFKEFATNETVVKNPESVDYYQLDYKMSV